VSLCKRGGQHPPKPTGSSIGCSFWSPFPQQYMRELCGEHPACLLLFFISFFFFVRFRTGNDEIAVSLVLSSSWQFVPLVFFFGNKPDHSSSYVFVAVPYDRIK
ncbi:unnamed protein product, partial [Ectocarpus sp. 4 AP-2014]